MKIKTIDIDTNEWFDRINGNSYFSSVVTINFQLKDEKKIYLGFQYGYGQHYLTSAMQELLRYKFIKPEFKNEGLTRYCREHGVILRHQKFENCKKRELLKYEDAQELNTQSLKP